MRQRTRDPRLEPRYKSGEVRLSHNHIAFLVGLLERPEGRAASITDWITAALPVAQRFYRGATWWTLYRSHGSVFGGWVVCKKLGSRITVALTPRGRAIAERTVRSRVTGYGPFVALPDPPRRLDPWYIQLLPERARPADLPPLCIAGFDLDWCPEGYARDLTELARFTVPVRTPWVISYAAQRVGRSWRLRAESFPNHDPELKLHRRAARAPLTLGQVIALVDRTACHGLDPLRLTGLTFIDAVISRWHLAAPIDSSQVPLLLRVESAVYPQLRAYYQERLRLWAAHFAASEPSAPLA